MQVAIKKYSQRKIYTLVSLKYDKPITNPAQAKPKPKPKPTQPNKTEQS